MIKYNLTILFLLALLSISFSVHSRTIYCSHRELCHLQELIAKENSLTDIKTETLVNITGDPHEYEPSANELKNLIKAPFLITGPSELNPWIKKILIQREQKKDLKTISLLFNSPLLSLYPKANTEALSHFWLYPKIYCSLKSTLTSDLKSWGYSLTNKTECPSQNIEKELKASLQKISMPIILTHDALLPLLLEMKGANSSTLVAIKGSGHHEEAGPQSIKKMIDALKAPAALWIVESGITVAPNIINKIRKQDIVLKLDTANSKSDQSFAILYELALKLKSINELHP